MNDKVVSIVEGMFRSIGSFDDDNFRSRVDFLYAAIHCTDYILRRQTE
jgi:hypothetical protein